MSNKSRSKHFTISINAESKHLLAENIGMLRDLGSLGIHKDVDFISRAGALELAIRLHNQMLKAAEDKGLEFIIQNNCTRLINEALHQVGIEIEVNEAGDIVTSIDNDILRNALNYSNGVENKKGRIR